MNKSTARTIEIIELLSSKGRALTLSEISRSLDIPKTSAFSIVSTLMSMNILEYENEQFKTIQLGIKLFEMTLSALGKSELHLVARPYLDQLLERAGETIYLGVESAGEIVYLMKAEGSQSVRTSANLGSRRPMYCTGLGKAMLAAHENEKIRELVREDTFPQLTEMTITTFDELMDDIEETRCRGFAIDRQESDLEISCISAPIYDASSKPVAAISIAMRSFTLSEEKIKKYGKIVPETALMISRKLGFTSSELYRCR